MITLLKPIILTFAKSDSVKRLIVDVLKKLVATTDNQLDDAAVESFNKAGPFPNPPLEMLKKGQAEIEWGFVVKA